MKRTKSDLERLQAQWKEERCKEAEAIDHAVQVSVEAMDGKARVDEVLARVLEKHSCPALFLEWTSDKFWALQMPKLLVDLNKIYAELKKRKIKKPYDVNFNDLDDNVYYLPHKKWRVIVHTGQNFRFLYIWGGSGRELHIRRFYDVWESTDEGKKRYVEKFVKDVRKKKVISLLLKANALTQEYADDYPDNPYPNRYSLASFVKDKFQVKFGDFRDVGYIATWREFSNKVEGSMSHHHELKLIMECFIPPILCELFEGNDAVSTNDTAQEKDFDSFGRMQ